MDQHEMMLALEAAQIGYNRDTRQPVSDIPPVFENVPRAIRAADVPIVEVEWKERIGNEKPPAPSFVL